VSAGRHERHGIVAEVPPAVKTTVTELPDSRVRLQVQVPPGELEGRLERKAHQLGRELKLPGFRRGKVPAPLVIRRVGREAVLEEAVRETLSSWYADAIETAGIVPVGDPQLDLGDLPPEGEALEFSIEIGVLPRPSWATIRASRSPAESRRCRRTTSSGRSRPSASAWPAWRPPSARLERATS
jgi:Bacterial trigger factor protein (TF)